MLQWWTVPGKDGGVLEQRQVPVPEAGPGQVLIKVVGAGVNRGELIARSAQHTRNPAARARPSGIECAGEVVDTGAGVAGITVGDRVMARGSACHAEYTVVDGASAMAVPDQLSLTEAGAIPNVFVTAHDAIVTNAQLKAGEKLLVTAGSSGVGSAAIQIAALLGAGQIIATTRNPAKSRKLLELGASQVVDTSQSDWESELDELNDGVDVIIDQVGGALFPALMRCMAIAGRYVTVGRNAGAQTELDLDALARDRLTLIGVTFRTRSPEQALICSQRFAEQLLPAFSTGELRPIVDRCFPLSQLPAAHEYMETNAQVGKIVLET